MVTQPDDGKPYFTIDGVRMDDSNDQVVYREYRKTPLGDNIMANGGLLHYTFEVPYED